MKALALCALALLAGCAVPTTQTRLAMDVEQLALAELWANNWITGVAPPGPDSERIIRKTIEAWRKRVDADRASLGGGK